jgi:hypothetical protein
MPGHENRLQRLVRVVGLIDDLDVCRLLELGDGAIADIIGPIIDVENPLLRRLSLLTRTAAGACEKRGRYRAEELRSLSGS